MGLEVAHIARGVRAADRAMADLEGVLNEADAVIGDGDTGSMLARVAAAMGKVELSQATDVGLAFNALARAVASATGSSLGTLLATALLSLGKAGRGRTEIPWPEFGLQLAAANQAMAARGGAQPGDKTVLDALEAVAAVLAGADAGEPADRLAAAAAQAAHQALDRLRAQPCKVGRARMFAQRSAGIDDPGMLAFALVMDAVAAGS